MIRTLAFLAIVASAFGNLILEELHCEFNVFGGFHQHALTVADAQKKGYEKVDNPPTPLSSGYSGLDLYLSKSDGYRVGIYYDENKYICGILIALPVDKITPYEDLEAKGFSYWTDNNSKSYLTVQVYFVNEDKQTRWRPSSESSTPVFGEHLTLQSANNSMYKVPTTAKEIAAHPDWVKQSCMPWMGQHYFHTVNPTCKDNFPFFLLTNEPNDIITGFGVMWFGTNECEMENPSAAAVQMIVPTAPQCFYDNAEKYGASTLHCYLVKHPRLINCWT